MATISQEQWDVMQATMARTNQMMEALQGERAQQQAFITGLEQRVTEAQDAAQQANTRPPQSARTGNDDSFWMEKVLKTMLNNKYTYGKVIFSEWTAQFTSIVSMYRSHFKQVLIHAQHQTSEITQDELRDVDIQANKQLCGTIIQVVTGDALTLDEHTG